MQISEDLKIEHCRRLTKKANSPLLIEKHFQTQGQKIFINKDYPPTIRDQRRILIIKRKELMSKGTVSKLRDNRLIVRGISYSVSNGRVISSNGDALEVLLYKDAWLWPSTWLWLCTPQYIPALRGVQSRSSMRFRLVCKDGGYHCSVNQLHFRVPCSRLPRGSRHYLYFTLQSSPLLVLLLPNVEKDFLAGFELFVVSNFWAGSDRKMVVSCPMLLHGKGGAIAPLVSHISEFPVHGYLGAHDTIYTSSYRAVRYLCCFAPYHV
ncbi:hypothetical protein LAZ67_8002326 [Cordylochernes scorpioides]|uniref:Uncharacterized protein n=1 Tax=Cordylochernes scorpioides TaxID=51811 RepID=A0ABY6KU21_9ARAC|nr:hypothetical protein LAZ67_8002326 [Cordylochernes scorpioides]